eukprot:GILK01000490.1.p2 GENE.GILK01000490.1~~GILK01000490.1.p2  ORF type:complete len:309 (-),score=47.81 GILK01000490.1:625-1509(-)
MADKKVIVVMGATGAQGGSVAKFLLQDGTFKVRALTRKADSPAAQALQAQGAEVVVADATDKSSLERAFAGAYGVFGLTNYWEQSIPVDKRFDYEVTTGKNIADAAKTAGVQHVVFSSLEHSNVHHFESKAQVADYMVSIGLPTTIVLTGFYLENVSPHGMLGAKVQEDGSLVLSLPIAGDKEIPAFAVADLGGFVLPLFKDPSYIGKTVHTVPFFFTIDQLCAEVQRQKGKTLKYVPIDPEVFKNFFPGADDLVLNMNYFRDHPESSGIRDVPQSRALYPQYQTLEQWVAATF